MCLRKNYNRCLKTIVLEVLSPSQRMYGYEITQKVKELSKGKIRLTEGAVYPYLYLFEQLGIVTTETSIVNNRIRKYYSLTVTVID